VSFAVSSELRVREDKKKESEKENKKKEKKNRPINKK